MCIWNRSFFLVLKDAIAFCDRSSYVRTSSVEVVGHSYVDLEAPLGVFGQESDFMGKTELLGKAPSPPLPVMESSS
jgi:hypothetical protein